MKKQTWWEGVEYASPEYYRLYRLHNLEKQRAYHREYDRAMYKLHPEREKARRIRYHVKYPHKIKAHHKLRYAVSKGIITRKPCTVCNESRTVAHHEDYTKPLSVVWYCEVHHKQRHKQILETKLTTVETI